MTKLHVGVVLTGVVVLTVLLLGPVGIGYTTTSSMTPVLSPGDAFITVDNQPVESGDIVVYRVEGMSDSIVHKVVDVTDSGYVTKGVNNEYTDQASGIPVVTSDDVRSTVLVFGGVPVHVPFFGWLLSFNVVFAYWIVAASVIFGALYFPGFRRLWDGWRTDGVYRVFKETATQNIEVTVKELGLWVGITVVVVFVTVVLVFV